VIGHEITHGFDDKGKWRHCLGENSKEFWKICTNVWSKNSFVQFCVHQGSESLFAADVKLVFKRPYRQSRYFLLHEILKFKIIETHQ